jgi:hypothetical protein
MDHEQTTLFYKVRQNPWDRLESSITQSWVKERQSFIDGIGPTYNSIRPLDLVNLAPHQN